MNVRVEDAMRAGSLLWFGDGIPTGYENPFDAPAYLLIFKTEPRTPGHDASRLEHLEGIRRKIEADHAAGEPFTFAELPGDHPARAFARGLGARP